MWVDFEEWFNNSSEQPLGAAESLNEPACDIDMMMDGYPMVNSITIILC